MARNQLSTFNIIDSTKLVQSAGAVNGDAFEVFYNDTTESIEVEKNGSLVTTGPVLDSNADSYDGLVEIFSFCDGTTLVKFRFELSYPYASRIQNANSPSCGSVVCDIFNAFPPRLKNPVGITATGEITVAAASSKMVQFGIDDFEYGSGNDGTFLFTVQGDKDVYQYTFTDLLPGNYVIVAKDSEGCFVTRNITLESDPTNEYAIKYYFEYVTHENQKRRVNIKQLNYTGSETEVTASGNPVMLDYGRTDTPTKLKAVIGSSLTVGFLAESINQWTDEFSRIEEKEYIVEWRDDPDGTDTLLWEGYVVPEIYQEPYGPLPYPIELTATDGLKDLENVKYDTGNALNGPAKVIDILAFCFNKINLQNKIRVGYNLYESSFDSTSSDDPLNQLYINQEVLQENGDPLDCLTVIERLVSSLAAKLFYWAGYYYIVRIKELDADINYRQFNVQGNYESNSTISVIKEIKGTNDTNRLRPLNGSNNIRFDDTYGVINVINQRVIAENLLTDFSKANIDGVLFTGWQAKLNGETGWFLIEEDKILTGYSGNQVTEPLTVWFLNITTSGNSNAYLEYANTLEYKGLDSFNINIDLFYETTKQLPFLKQRYSFQVGNKYYNATDNTWTTTETINTAIFEEQNKLTEINIQGTFDESVTTNTTDSYILRIYNPDIVYADVVDNDNDLQADIRALDSSVYEPGDRIIGRKETINRWELYFFRLEESVRTTDGIFVIEPDDNSDYRWVLQDQVFITKGGRAEAVNNTYYNNVRLLTFPNGQNIEETKINQFVAGSNNIRELDYELNFFDLDTTTNNSENLVLNYWKKQDGTPTSSWGSENKKIQTLIGEFIAGQYKYPAKLVNLSLYCEDIDFYPINAVRDTFDNNRVYIWNSLSINDRAREVSGEFVEIGSDTEIELFEHTQDEHTPTEHS